ncbi:hypothetical protein BBO99_00008749 [Phytophthora kernoviae]|uniref:Serine/threonine specific protein phosphatases domain-containing protein n=2 Tax=Phytophthora kernoviae TaxID=325452 RepID=A0A421GE78_9STRA|nr:hypothetical protein G195_010223 [Phytophthora kernoviae 00238/432]KAG2523149.1 hypothetical protein JM16_005425 [Phytophthora kernoviae]KAG2524867.1 hypothetical protein JM18_005199 [Phytophthora kernoviae]RLN74778.1 hypothetical protein BBO99_00008749 [Phytophthora kernoviae]
MARRRETKVLLALEDVRATFEQQTPLSVKDALGVIHEAQFFMSQEENVVAVPQRASTYVFGDIHGQFFDLMQLMDAAGVAELRGIGAQATFEFLANNKLLSLVRAHEYEDEGFMFHFDSEEFKQLDKRQDKSMPPLITVFSAPNYCDSYDNMWLLNMKILQNDGDA